MAIDFTRYQTPGIYTESVPGPQLAVRSSVPTAVATFGRAVGYRTYRESLIINPDTQVPSTTQTITVKGSPTSGDFNLSFKDEEMAEPLLIEATADELKASLEAISTIGAGNLDVTGIDGGPWTVNFVNDRAGESQPPFVVTDTNFVGGTGANIEVIHEDHGTPALNRTLAQKGIKTDTIVVVDPDSATTYVEGRDYTVELISVSGTPDERDDTYTISRVANNSSMIKAGYTVQLAYQYTDVDYFKVYALYDYDDVRDIYGEPFDENGFVQSEVTLCAQFAFINGASTVLTCAIDPEDPELVTIADYEDALDKFRDEDQIAIIVPGTGKQEIQGRVQNHVVSQSNNKYERRAIIGIDGVTNPVESSVRVGYAQALTEQRIALISPASFDYYATEMNKMIPLGGQYMAAAVAGVAASMIAAEPLTHKRVLGFAGPTESQREGEKNLESANGLMVVERTRRNIVQVRHGVTTNPTDLLTREWNIIGQQDVMVYRIRDYLDADGLIGQAIYDTTLIQVKASAESALDSLTRDRIIVGYQNLKVRQIGTMPDVIEVRFEWRPAYPLNYIVVRYSVAVMSGDVTVTETTL